MATRRTAELRRLRRCLPVKNLGTEKLELLFPSGGAHECRTHRVIASGARRHYPWLGICARCTEYIKAFRVVHACLLRGHGHA